MIGKTAVKPTASNAAVYLRVIRYAKSPAATRYGLVYPIQFTSNWRHP